MLWRQMTVTAAVARYRYRALGEIFQSIFHDVAAVPRIGRCSRRQHCRASLTCAPGPTQFKRQQRHVRCVSSQHGIGKSYAITRQTRQAANLLSSSPAATHPTGSTTTQSVQANRRNALENNESGRSSAHVIVRVFSDPPAKTQQSQHVTPIWSQPKNQAAGLRCPTCGLHRNRTEQAFSHSEPWRTPCRNPTTITQQEDCDDVPC